MGAVHFSIDVDLTALLARELGIKVFVETGTLRGDTVSAVKDLFDEIHTCELSSQLHAAAAQKFAGYRHIECHLGSSPNVLKEIVPVVGDRPAVFWLDAHWCAAEHVAEAPVQCPLTQELDALGPLHKRSVVWIDDARFFQSPPPYPLVSEGWPIFHEVLAKLLALGGQSHRIIFANDTILLYPVSCEQRLLEYVRTHGVDWLEIAHKANVVLPQMTAARDAYEAHGRELEKLIESPKTP